MTGQLIGLASVGVTSGRSWIFQTGGGLTLEESPAMYYLAKIQQKKNPHENERIWTRKRVPGTPTIESATGYPPPPQS